MTQSPIPVVRHRRPATLSLDASAPGWIGGSVPSGDSGFQFRFADEASKDGFAVVVSSTDGSVASFSS